MNPESDQRNSIPGLETNSKFLWHESKRLIDGRTKVERLGRAPTCASTRLAGRVRDRQFAADSLRQQVGDLGVTRDSFGVTRLWILPK
jgi:hypothetical protein